MYHIVQITRCTVTTCARVMVLRQRDTSSEAFSKRCLIYLRRKSVSKGREYYDNAGTSLAQERKREREREGRMSKGEEKRRRREPSTLSDGDHRYRCRDGSFDAWTKRSKKNVPIIDGHCTSKRILIFLPNRFHSPFFFHSGEIQMK